MGGLQPIRSIRGFVFALAFLAAGAHPKVVAEMSAAIQQWRSKYPIAGTRNEIAPPPGSLRILDWMHGETGRLLYDCEPYALLGGGLCK